MTGRNPQLITPGKFKLNFRYVIFKQILVIDGCEIALIWMSLDFTNAEIQNYLFFYGSLGPQAMIHMGPWALGLSSIIDAFLHGKF